MDNTENNGVKSTDDFDVERQQVTEDAELRVYTAGDVAAIIDNRESIMELFGRVERLEEQIESHEEDP